MKNTKWIWRTLSILLALVVLAGVGAAGFRIGFMRGLNTTQNKDGTVVFFGHMQKFGGDFNEKVVRTGNPHMQGFDQGFKRGMRHGGIASHLFGLIHLAIFGLLLWAGYQLYQKSGWKFVKVNAPEEVEPVEAKPAEVKSAGKKKK